MFADCTVCTKVTSGVMFWKSLLRKVCLTLVDYSVLNLDNWNVEMKNVLIRCLTLLVTWTAALEKKCPAPWTEEWTLDYGRYLKQLFTRAKDIGSGLGDANYDLEICEPLMTNLTCKVSGTFGNRPGDLFESASRNLPDE